MLRLIVLLLIVGHAQAREVHKEITITTQQWPPYQFESNRIQSGFAINALSCVMKRLNQDYRVIFLPWGRAQNGVAQGKYDGFFSASQNSTRDSYAVHSNTFIEQQWNFYLLKDTTISLDKQAIKQDAKFGSRKHANTTFWLKRNDFKVIYETTRVEELIKLLQAGKIDGIMENKLLFSDAVNRAHLSMSQFKVVPNISKPLGVYFGKIFLQSYPDFLNQFNAHTEACRFETYD
ncbi:ABC transporter substrate-binding protein [Shewanella sp. UCD-KL12]|uniref:substrate-binding periplasmic protein n=1 Tax=Shewanella sp. UCD-KL12 TaxID=1917163 RepID=UPI0015C3ED93|nr:transporter substrate-binding domain-containing protein [Shewanella sp. UCD-KL12]